MNDKIEFPGVTIDASEPVRMDYSGKTTLDTSGAAGPSATPIDWSNVTTPSSKYGFFDPNIPPGNIEFHSMGKCAMRITSEGVAVPPDLTTDEAAKAVIEALDVHIKHVVAAHRGALEKALGALEMEQVSYSQNQQAIAAIKEVLK